MSKEWAFLRGATLSRTPRLLLCWLLCYPFQSAGDLALALERDTSVIAAHLREIESRGLVEPLAPAWLDGRVWSLTTDGIRLVARGVGIDWTRLAKQWHVTRSAQERLVPRLFSLMPVQRVVLGLCAGAPSGLAALEGGRRPMVRWHWLRGWQQRFMDQQRIVTVQVDAVVVWRCETRGRAGSLALSLTPTSAQTEGVWNSLLIVCERDIDDRHSIRQRLARLLHYRESAEWRARQRPFPPVLILLNQPHHAERWRREMHALAQTWRANPLVGAVAVIPRDGAMLFDPWRWSWQKLADGSPVRLSHLLIPASPDDWPDGVRDHLKAVQNVITPLLKRRVSVERARTRQPAKSHPMSIIPRTSAGWRTYLAACSLDMGQRHMALLTLLAHHPLLSTTELAALMGIADVSAACYLRDLRREGCVRAASLTGDEGPRWHLAEGGLRLVAAMQQFSVQRLGSFQDESPGDKTARVSEAEPLLIPRALPRLARYPLHTAGIYGFIAALHRAASAHQTMISWWEMGEACERSYPWHGTRHNLRPDAEFVLAQQDATRLRHLRYWLEYDRGTMRRRDLEAKMHTYADYVRAREWAKDGLARLPRLLFVVPDTGQERRVAAAAESLLTGLPLRVLVTTAGHIAAADPFAPIWRQMNPPGGEGRQTLY